MYGGQEIGGCFFSFKLETQGMVQKGTLKLYTNSAARQVYVHCKSHTSNRCEGKAGWEGWSRGGINPYQGPICIALGCDRRAVWGDLMKCQQVVISTGVVPRKVQALCFFLILY